MQFKGKIVCVFILSAVICMPIFGKTGREREKNLYVGTNYHPHDVESEQWKKDVSLMKDAGFCVVRMGHLAWDSYEPEDGKFTFEWFDSVMNLMNEAGIKVILDIAVRPAPLWLHKKYPTINVGDANNNRTYPNTRYMEDVGDPHYQKYALRFTDTITKRYATHPALLAFGVDNEPGGGKISYSEEVRQRFIQWLEKKYQTTDSLNKAWAAQRWSRRISEFQEVGLPESGAPERKLDFRRFLSDEINDFYFKMLDIIERNAPKALINTNAWYYCPQKYYDYAPMAYSNRMTREGCGFYPGTSLVKNNGLKSALFGIARIQYEAETPFWCNEFTTMTAPKGAIRKYAWLSLMYGNQMVCGWTWQTMHAGEEQFLLGMIDWDMETNGKYEEYKQLSEEFKKIESFMPYHVNADVAIAFSFDSQMSSNRNYLTGSSHEDQAETCFNVMFNRNADVRIVDVEQSPLNYKLLIIPGMSVMSKKSAENIRSFVQNGGIVVMIAPSAVLNENGQVFKTTLPGMLSDVFGIRMGGYGETKAMNELSRMNLKGEELAININGEEIKTNANTYDLITPKGAKTIASIISLDKDYPIITTNKYGKGEAIYVGISAKEDFLEILINKIMQENDLKKGPDVPQGVCARQIDDKHLMMFNITTETKTINIKGKAKSLINDNVYQESITLGANEPEFIEFQ